MASNNEPRRNTAEIYYQPGDHVHYRPFCSRDSKTPETKGTIEEVLTRDDKPYYKIGNDATGKAITVSQERIIGKI